VKIKFIFILFCCICLAACGGKKTVKPKAAPPLTAKPATAAKTATAPSAAPNTMPSPAPAEQKPGADEPTKPGGYYLDDGPGDNPPQNIDSIPNAVPKKEALNPRTNKPYRALGEVYTPMTSYKPYKERGIASWYGKRFHGKKTSSGETYDMYSMSAAHTILPLPSYVKVTNPANGRSVIVRVNDRGPFKHSRIIDLSFAAAYKLGYANKGSTLVEVEAIDPSNANDYTNVDTKPTVAAVPASVESVLTEPTLIDPTVKNPAITGSATTSPHTTNPPTTNPPTTIPANTSSASNTTLENGYFVQAGAFKNESNADALIKKIEGLDIEQNAGFNKVYNNGLYRLKIGPLETKQAADKTAADIRRLLNIPAITINQTSTVNQTNTVNQ
jgi:rare lipoprotein A